MKKIISIIPVLFICCFGYCQIAFQDALRLRANILNGTFNPDKRLQTDTILSLYIPDPDDNISSTFEINPFTQSFFSSRTPHNSITGIKSLISSAGNLDVSNIADGFAKFLVKRTKEELSISFFSKFYDLLKKDEYKDAQLLFPQTFTILNVIGKEIYNYQAYINSLREVFEKDLNGLLDHLPQVINDGRYNFFFTTHPELKATCLSATYIGKQLLGKQHPGKIIADYNTFLLDSVPDVKAGVQTLQLFSESLRSSGTDHYWINPDSLDLLTKDPVTLKLYFGLLYQKAKTLKIKFLSADLSTIFAENLLPAATSINNYNGFIKGFITQANTVSQSIKNITRKEKDKISFTDYYDFYNSSLDLIEYAGQVGELPGVKQKINTEKLPLYIKVVRVGGNAALDISRRNYGSAVINISGLYNFAFPTGDVNLKKSQSNTEAVKTFLLKYGLFLSEVVQAENSDDVTKAIEASALPSGSSRIKRETAFNVSLNGYAGLFVGNEIIKDVDKSQPFKKINSYGVIAPIGVAISTGYKHWSFSAFISLVDLGTVAAYRFKDDTTAQIPDIKLKNIFSPGIFFSIGIPKSPLSFNLGTQLGPNLRKIDNNNSSQPSEDGSNRIYWRVSASLCVDIPVLNFYSTSK